MVKREQFMPGQNGDFYLAGNEQFSLPCGAPFIEFLNEGEVGK